MIRLLALVQKPEGLSPGQRFRLEQWAPLLRREHGIDIEFAVFESPRLTKVLYLPGHHAEKAALLIKDTWRRRLAYRRARDFDAVVIYREAASLGPAIYERLLARAGIPIIYDFDDAIWIPGAGSVNGIFSHLRFQAKTGTICRLSRAVVVGNEYLASYARRYTDRVHVVPTSIDLGTYPVQPEAASDGKLVIAWSGSLATLIHLDAARPAIEKLAKRRKVEVRVICNAAPKRGFEGAETTFVPWKGDEEAKAIGASHVGIMPLPDDQFARGKCGLKALQYMATGRPVVLSPVGVNTEIVRSGDNGILAASVDEWVDALDRLGSSPELRVRLGAAGRKTVEERYSSTAVAAQFANVVRTTLGGAS
jgi:glycosyltransferase involved in cell wall biosynthesis